MEHGLMHTKVSFTKEEFFNIFCTIFVVTFVLTFTQWGEGNQFFSVGISNFLRIFHLVFLAFFFNIFVKKWYALKRGYIGTYSAAKFLLSIGIYLSFLFSATVPIFGLGYMDYKVIMQKKLGQRFYGHNTGCMYKIVFAGILFNLLFAFLGKVLLFSTGYSYFEEIIIVNFIIIFYQIIPLEFLEILSYRFIPRKTFHASSKASDGLYVLYHSRGLYAYICGFLIFFAFLIWAPGFWSILVSLLMGFLIYHVFKRYYEYEKNSDNSKKYLFS